MQSFRRSFGKGLGFGTGAAVALLLVLGAVLYAQSLATFSSGQVVSASALNSNFSILNANVSALNARVAPVGGIIAWHKSLTGVPTLPVGWVECDGSVITDAESPLNGQTTPNLNAAPNAWNANGYFLRGAAASGGTEADTFQSHRHWRNTTNLAEHDMRSAAGGGIVGFVPGGFYPSTQVTTGEPVNGVFGAPRTGSETRPVSFLVVWIMRIK